MKTYWVSVPMTARITVEVEAESEEDAIERVLTETELQDAFDNIDEWELHKRIVQGNVFYGITNEIEVEEIK